MARAGMLTMACLLAVACETSSRPRSLVDVLQVVAIECDPPELGPYETLTIHPLVADPEKPGSALEYLVFACTSYTGVSGCLEEMELADEEDLEAEELNLTEEDYRYYMERFVVRGQTASTGMAAEFTASMRTPLNHYYLLTELGYTEIPSTVSVLTCRPGVCPLLDAIDAYLEEAPGAPTGEELLTILSDPELLLSGLPMEGVAMGRKTYRISLRDGADRNQNPGIAAASLVGCDQLSSSGGSCTVQVEIDPYALQIYYPDPDSTSFTAQEAVVLRFYSSAGTMTPFTAQVAPSSSPVQSGSLVLEPGEVPSSLGFFIAAVDSRGGMSHTFLSVP